MLRLDQAGMDVLRLHVWHCKCHRDWSQLHQLMIVLQTCGKNEVKEHMYMGENRMVKTRKTEGDTKVRVGC